MSTTDIQHALISLLPTLNGTIPPELTNLATSILAQSRTCAANLKPEEEIARPYACAEIACKRLRSRLRLAETISRPPCGPRAYKKFLTFLDWSLPRSAPPKNTGDGNHGAGSQLARGKATNTPTKRTNPPVVGPNLATPTTTPGKEPAFTGKIGASTPLGSSTQLEAPVWVMPLVRSLCITFKTPLLPPHVYTGVCVVLKLSELWPAAPSQTEEEATQLRGTATALTVAIFFMVLTRMQRGKLTPDSYVEKCVEASDMVRMARGPELEKEDVDNWIRRMNSEGWCRGQEWWSNVPLDVISIDGNSGGGGDDELSEEDGVICRRRGKRKVVGEEDAEEEDPEGVLLPGLGTMMQDAVDWVSEERDRDYLEWKQDILRKIRQMEKGKTRAAIAVR